MVRGLTRTSGMAKPGLANRSEGSEALGAPACQGRPMEVRVGLAGQGPAQNLVSPSDGSPHFQLQ